MPRNPWKNLQSFFLFFCLHNWYICSLWQKSRQNYQKLILQDFCPRWEILIPVSPRNNIPFENFRHLFQTYEFKIVNIYISKDMSEHKLIESSRSCLVLVTQQVRLEGLFLLQKLYEPNPVSELWKHLRFSFHMQIMFGFFWLVFFFPQVVTNNLQSMS